MIIEVKQTKYRICSNLKVANTIFSRLLGLMFKKSMLGFDGLLIDPCNSIHTFFMRFSIDVIFLDSDNRIVKIIHSMKPWKMTWIYFKAKKVLELKAGTLNDNVSIGDELEIKCLS